MLLRAEQAVAGTVATMSQSNRGYPAKLKESFWRRERRKYRLMTTSAASPRKLAASLLPHHSPLPKEKHMPTQFPKAR